MFFDIRFIYRADLGRNNLPDNHIESFLSQKLREIFNARLALYGSLTCLFKI